MEEVITARGHEHVTAHHESTFEVTSDEFLTPAGDCILAIDADRTPRDFDDAFVTACQDAAARITITCEAAGLTEQVTGRGHPDLTFTSNRSLVCRTSEYVDGRTVAVETSQAAAGFNRQLVAALAEGARLDVTLRVD